MRRVLAAALAVAAALAACGAGGPQRAAGQPDPETTRACRAPALAAAPSPSRPWFGVHAVLRDEAPGDRHARAVAACNLGVAILREDLDWATVQPHAGSGLDFRAYDRVALSAAERGLTLLPILDGVPAWAGPDPKGSPTRVRAYARFAAAAVRRYGPGGAFWREHPSAPLRPVHWWEHLNEVYVHDASATRYARAVVAASAAMRAADPGARILIGAETRWVAPGGHVATDWLGSLYRVDPRIGASFDAVSVHPYSWPQRPTVYTPGPDAPLQARRIEEIHATLVAHGDARKHLWVTEFGAPTCRDTKRCETRARQAADIAAVARLRDTRWRTYVDALVLYTLRDGDSRSADPEQGFGVLDDAGHRKPGWTVFRALARRATARSAAGAAR